MPDGGLADLSFAIQSAKGTPAASAAYRTYLSGGGLDPLKSFAELSDRSSEGFPQRSVITAWGADGEPEIFARPEPLGLLLYGALGAKSVSGASDPFTHVFTAAASLPWLTFWRMVGGIVVDQFVDCQIATLRLVSEAGQPLRVSFRVLGLSTRYRTADQVIGVTLTAPFLHYHAAGALLADGVAVRSISSVDVQLDNRKELVPGPLGLGWRLAGGGTRLLRIETEQIPDPSLRNRYFYGSSSPADGAIGVSTQVQIGLDLTWTLSATRTLRLQVPLVEPAEIAGYRTNPDHAPMRERRAYRALRGGSTIMTATLKNGVSAY